jgi:hypothetical protein
VWRYLGKPRKTSVSIAGLWNGIRIWDLPNMEQKCYWMQPDVWVSLQWSVPWLIDFVTPSNYGWNSKVQMSFSSFFCVAVRVCSVNPGLPSLLQKSLAQVELSVDPSLYILGVTCYNGGFKRCRGRRFLGNESDLYQRHASRKFLVRFCVFLTSLSVMISQNTCYILV